MSDWVHRVIHMTLFMTQTFMNDGFYNVSLWSTAEKQTQNGRFLPPLQREGSTGLMSRWGGLCRWEESTSDRQSADSKRINAGSVEGGKTRSVLLRNKDAHFISSPLLFQREKRKNDWKTGFIVWGVFTGVMGSGITSTNPGGRLEDFLQHCRKKTPHLSL